MFLFREDRGSACSRWNVCLGFGVTFSRCYLGLLLGVTRIPASEASRATVQVSVSVLAER